MKSYLFIVIITSIAISLSELILPNGKLKTVASTAFSLILLLTTLTPLSGSKLDISVPTFGIESNIDVNTESYIIEYFNDKNEEYYEKEYNLILKAENLITEKIIVEISNNKIIKIEIYLSNLVIPENNQHINNIVMQNYVADILGVDSKIVVVYG